MDLYVPKSEEFIKTSQNMIKNWWNKGKQTQQQPSTQNSRELGQLLNNGLQSFVKTFNDIAKKQDSFIKTTLNPLLKRVNELQKRLSNSEHYVHFSQPVVTAIQQFINSLNYAVQQLQAEDQQDSLLLMKILNPIHQQANSIIAAMDGKPAQPQQNQLPNQTPQNQLPNQTPTENVTPIPGILETPNRPPWTRASLTPGLGSSKIIFGK